MPLHRLRSVAVGAVTIAVATAAHGAAGGGVLAGSGLVILLLVGAVTGGAAMSLGAMPTARTAYRSLLPILAAGQVAAHVVLSAVLGQHGAAHPSAVHPSAVHPSAVHHGAAHHGVGYHEAVPAVHGESLPMLLAHAVAIIVAATLIQAGERGCSCVTGFIKQAVALLARVARVATSELPDVFGAGEQEPPRLRPRLLVAGLSSRGPPAPAFQ